MNARFGPAAPLWALAFMALGLVGCASTPTQRAAVDPANLGRADIDTGATPNAAGPIQRWIRALRAEAEGRDADAGAAWLALMREPTAPSRLRLDAGYALQAAVDRTPWTDGQLRVLRALMATPGAIGRGAAAVLADAAVRRGRFDLRAEAHTRLGRISAYRLRPYRPGADGALRPQFSPADGSSGPWSPRIPTPDGACFAGEGGPGVMEFAVEIAASSHPRTLVLIGRGGTLVRDGARVQRCVDPKLTGGPPRCSVPIDFGPARTLFIAAGDTDSAPSRLVALNPEGLADAPRISTPVPSWIDEALLRAEAADHQAAWARAPGGQFLGGGGATAVSERVAGEPDLLAHRQAQSLLDDDDFDPEVRRRRAVDHLAQVLVRDPKLGAARRLLVRLLLSSGARDEALAVAGGGSVGDGAFALALELAADRPQNGARRTLAHAWLKANPMSCAAVDAELDASWKRRLITGGAPLRGLARCPDLTLRAAGLLMESGRLVEARRWLMPLLDRAPPGRHRGQIRLLLIQIALRESDLERAEALALEGRAAMEALHGVSHALQQIKDERGHGPEAGAFASITPDGALALPLRDSKALRKSAWRRRRSTEGGAEVSAMVLRNEHHLIRDSEGVTLHRVHQLVHLLDGDALTRWGERTLPDGAKLLRARTWVAGPRGGPARAFDAESLGPKGAISLPALAPDVIIEVAWIEPLKRPNAGPFPEGLPPIRLDSPRAPVRRATITVETPPGAPLTLVRTGDAPALEPTKAQWPGHQSHTVTVGPFARAQAEPLDPRPDRRVASIRLVPPASDAPAILARVHRWTAPRLNPTPAVYRFLAQATAGLSLDADPLTRLRAVYDRILRTITDEGADPFQSWPGRIATHQRGDRAVLLVAAARAMGFAAELAVARPAYRGEWLGLDAPFEAADWVLPLVHIPLPDGASLWLDPTNPFAPMGTLAPLVRGVPTLIIGADKARWGTTPKGDAAGSMGRRRVVIDVQIADDGSWTASGAETLTGAIAMSWRLSLSRLKAAARPKILAGLITAALPGADLGPISIESLADFKVRSDPLIIRWTARGHAVSAGVDFRMPMGLSPENLRAATVFLQERTAPLFLNRVSAEDLTVRLHLPIGWRLIRPPTPQSIRHPAGSATPNLTLDRTWFEDDGVWTITKSLTLDLVERPPAGYAEWVAAAKAVDRADRILLTFRPPLEP